jgi:hypothetical protein
MTTQKKQQNQKQQKPTTVFVLAPKLDFVHSVDKTRKAGYARLILNCQEEVSHARPARCDYTRPAAL